MKSDLMETQDPMEGTAPTVRQCTARSKQSGQRCKRSPLPGSNVCKFHGGGAPQVKAKAAVRLAALVDPAISRLAELLASEENNVAIRAVIDVLDRNGFKPKDQLQVESSEYESAEHEFHILLAEVLSPAELEDLRNRFQAARAKRLTAINHPNDTTTVL